MQNRWYPAGSRKIQKDRNWGIGKDRTFLSHPTHQFAPPKLYLFLSTHLSRVTGNIYLFLSLCFGNIYLFLSLSLSADWSSIYLFLSLIYLPIVQFLISLYIPQYLFLPRNEECSWKSIVSILHRGRLLLHWP